MTGTKYDMSKMTKTYLKIRAEKARITKEHKEQVANLDKQMDTLKAAMLEHCKEHNVSSIKTEVGTIIRKEDTRYWTADWESMHGFIQEHGALYLLDKRLNQSNIKQFLVENPDISPPGLNVKSEYNIAVRKA